MNACHSVRVATWICIALLTACNAGAQDVRLNNFVTELVNVSVRATTTGDVGEAPPRTYSFHTDREGWVFISISSPGAGVRALLDGEHVIASERLPEKPAEAMRLTYKGEHELRLFVRRAGRDMKLVVRSIPMLQISELSFAILPKERPPSGYRRVPRYTWDFYKKAVLPNVNVIV